MSSGQAPGPVPSGAGGGRGRPGNGRIRGFLLAVVVLGSVGLSAELLLLEHWETVWQAIPLAVLAAALGGALGLWRHPGPATVRLFRWIMAAALLAGVVGVGLHLKGNWAFELEVDPETSGLSLVWAALRGGVPALAPGSMVQLGLVGLVLTYRHPALVPYHETDLPDDSGFDPKEHA